MLGSCFTKGMEENSKRPFFSSPDDLFDDDYYDDQPPEKKRRLTQEQVFKQLNSENIMQLFHFFVSFLLNGWGWNCGIWSLNWMLILMAYSFDSMCCCFNATTFESMLISLFSSVVKKN